MLVWLLCQLKRCSARLTKNGESFALMTSFDLENIDLRPPNLHQKELLCGPTPPPNFGVSSSIGSRYSRGHYMPHPGRVILILSLARVLTAVNSRIHETLQGNRELPEESRRSADHLVNPQNNDSHQSVREFPTHSIQSS